MFRTLYSRYSNVKAGKFVAGAGEESNGEEFEALNDIEKVLNKIGISMRDTSAEFRNFDDVLAEIAEKWASLSDVEKNAISTAFAGTRQREVFNVLMENYGEVDKFENIAKNSQGSTKEKMEIYRDSVEASKNRKTAAIEEFTQNFNILGMDGAEILTKWNDLLTYIIKNWKEIIGFIATVTFLSKGLLSGSMFGGLVKLMQSLTVSAMNFSNTMQTMGTNLYNSPIMGLLPRTLSAGGKLIGQGVGWLGGKIDNGISRAATNTYGSVSGWLGNKISNYSTIQDMRAIDGARFGDRISGLGQGLSQRFSRPSELMSRVFGGPSGNKTQYYRNDGSGGYYWADGKGNYRSIQKSLKNEYGSVKHQGTRAFTDRQRPGRGYTMQKGHNNSDLRVYDKNGYLTFDSGRNRFENFMYRTSASVKSSKVGQWVGGQAKGLGTYLNENYLMPIKAKTAHLLTKSNTTKPISQQTTYKRPIGPEAYSNQKLSTMPTESNVKQALREAGNTIWGPLRGQQSQSAGQGWRANALSQAQNIQSMRVYSAAMKAGTQMGYDGIQADKAGQFFSGMNAKQAEIFNSLSSEQQKALIEKYGAEDPENLLKSSLEANTRATQDNTAALRGDDADGTNNTQTDNSQGANTLLEDTGDQLLIPGLGESLDEVGDTLVDSAQNAGEITTKKAAEAGAEDVASETKGGDINIAAETKGAQIELTAEQEAAMKEYIEGSGVGKRDASMISGIAQDRKLQAEQAKKAKMQNLGGAASSALAMGTMMASGMIMSNHVSGTGMSEGQQSATTMLATMAPMIGMMFGPWGALIGTAVSALTVGITALVDANVETAEEIREAAKEAKEELSDFTNRIEKNTSENKELKDLEKRFSELSKGVDEDGNNISLTTTEFEEYQSVLEKIINASDRLYKSYNSQGKIIAKVHGDLEDYDNLLMATIEENNKQIVKDSDLYTKAVGSRVDVLKEVIIDAEESHALKNTRENDWGLDFDDWYFNSDSYGKINGKAVVGAEDGMFSSWSNFGAAVTTNSDFGAESTKDNLIAYVNAALEAGLDKHDMTNEVMQMGITHGFFRKDLTRNEAEQLVSSIVNEIESLEYVYQEANKAYSDQMQQDMITALQSSELYFTLSEDSQNYLASLIGQIDYSAYHTDVDGNIIRDKNGQTVKKTDAEIQTDAENSAQTSQNLVQWAAKNASQFQFVKNFNADTASASDWDRYQLIVSEMAGQGADSESVKAIYGSHHFSLENTEWISQKQKIWDNLNNPEITNKFGIDTFTLQELRYLNKYKDDALIKNALNSPNVTGADIKQIVKELNIGLTGTTSEYISLLKTQIGNIQDDDGNYKYNDRLKTDVISALSEDEIINSHAYKQLQKVANTIGLTVEELIEGSTVLGSIDAYGHTTMALEEISNLFKELGDALTQFAENGSLSLETLNALLDQFDASDILDKLNDPQELRRFLSQLYSYQSLNYKAAIKTKWDTSTDMLPKIINTVEQAGLSVGNTAQAVLEAFGNLDNIIKIQDHINNYGVNDEGVIDTNEEYWKLTGGNNLDKYKDKNAHSFEKDFMRAFGINVDELEYSEAKSQMENEMSAILKDIPAFAGGSYNYDSMMGIFKNLITKNQDTFNAFTDYANNYTTLESLYTAKKVIENETWKAVIDDAHKDLSDAFDAGLMSVDNYIDGLSKLNKSEYITAQKARELAETLEDISLEELTRQLQSGSISHEKYDSEMSKLIKQNVVGSKDWISIVDQYINHFTENIKEYGDQQNLLEDDDYYGRLQLWAQQREQQQRKIAATEAKGRLMYGDDYNVEEDSVLSQEMSEFLNVLQEGATIISEWHDDFQRDYNYGLIGRQDYIEHLETLINLRDEETGELIAQAEAIKEYREEQEKLKFETYSEAFTDGIDSAETYRAYLSDLMKQNNKDTDQYRQYRDAYIDSFQAERDSSKKQSELLAEHDYKGKIQLLQNDILTGEKMLAALEAAGMKNSDLYRDTLKSVADDKKQILEYTKQIYEYEVKQSELIIDAYSNIISYGMDELQSRQKEINDMYDDEISKLEDINNQKQRSIELTKLQQALEEAKKEKTRVYQSGIGFVYQENKTKVKEAKQNLDNYLDERKIQDLQYAQNQQNKLMEDQIERLQKIQDYLTNIKETANANASVLDLVYAGIVPQGSTLSESMNYIINGAVSGEGADNKILSLDSRFEEYRNIYDINSELLNTFIDNYDDQMANLAGWASEYQSASDMVAQFKSDFDSVVNGDSSKVTSLEQQLKDFLGGKTYADWTDELSTLFASDVASETLTIATPDFSAITNAIATATQELNASLNAIATAVGFSIGSIDTLTSKFHTYTRNNGTRIDDSGNVHYISYTGETAQVGDKVYSQIYDTESKKTAWVEGKGTAGNVIQGDPVIYDYQWIKAQQANNGQNPNAEEKVGKDYKKSHTATIDKKDLLSKTSTDGTWDKEYLKGANIAGYEYKKNQVSDDTIKYDSDDSITEIVNRELKSENVVEYTIGGQKFTRFHNTATGEYGMLKGRAEDVVRIHDEIMTVDGITSTLSYLVAKKDTPYIMFTKEGVEKLIGSGVWSTYDKYKKWLTNDDGTYKDHKLAKALLKYGPNPNNGDDLAQQKFYKIAQNKGTFSSYSTGIENGPVTYTGLAMLHGSPSSPEYVLNSDQAGTLLKNLATMTMSPYQAPKVDSYNHGSNSTIYQFNGDMNLPNVQRPDQFFSELMKQANVQFPTIKKNYR